MTIASMLALAVLTACGAPHAPPPPPAPPAPAPKPAPPPTPRPDNGIALKVTPADADVMIDDDAPRRAAALPEVIALKPGIHQLVVAKDGYKTYRVEFAVVSGKTETFSVQLEAKP